MNHFILKVIKIIYRKFIDLISNIYNYYLYFFDLIQYKYFKKNDGRFSTRFIDIYPCVSDKTLTTEFEPHYTYHLAWAARKIAKTKPKIHVDISSSLQFSTIASAFIPIKFYDFRPAAVKLENFESEKADINLLPFADNSIKSLSCMHVIEHIGLGRYGDKIDPRGDLKAIKELIRVLAKNGNLFFVTPVGKPRVQFNAHRIYSKDQILKYFADLKLIEMSYIADDYKRGFIDNPKGGFCDEQRWGCGCFWFKKV